MISQRDEFNRILLKDEAHARRLCANLCAAQPNLPRLKNIAIVGAYDAEIGGAGADSGRLTHTMEYLLRSGFMIDPDFEVDRVNFREGRDFLTEKKQADLVFIAFILAEHMYRKTTVYEAYMNERAKETENFNQIFGVALSKHHSDDGWRARMKSAGVKMAVTYGGVRELGTSHICAPDGQAGLIAALPSPPHDTWQYVGSPIYDDITYDIETKPDLRVLYNDAANDLPLKWLGFAADPDYLRAMRDHLSPDTDLARHVRNLSL